MEPKFTVEYSKQLNEVFQETIARLELVQLFPVNENTPETVAASACRCVVDKNYFLPCQEVQKPLNEWKFHNDFDKLIRMLHSVIEELEKSHTINKLIDQLESSSLVLLDSHLALKNFTEQSKEVEKLEELLSHQEEMAYQKATAVDNDLFNSRILQCKLEHELEVEKTYIISWVDTQVRQQIMKLSDDEKNEKLVDVSLKSSATDDAYYRTCKFYGEKIKKLNSEFRNINSEYDLQLEQVETDLQIALNERKNQLRDVQIERESFKKREEEMKSYQEAKTKKEAEKKLRELQEVKSVVIQSWWRGVMVRSHHGKPKAFKQRAKQLKKSLAKKQREQKKKLSKQK